MNLTTDIMEAYRELYWATADDLENTDTLYES